ncbi:glycoside hydrolase family 26 protein [Cystobasidium minutum MCA 4210]|uniref:glycoside hydrolase family 26 protein n=1 Tax=Cystobasidium minutum MCA 4210 TaxID=1397322 RepID=UPI0034CDDFE7|eukprot:jgi/Rhomi1/207805/estExt_Genemark1.C_1_t20268
MVRIHEASSATIAALCACACAFLAQGVQAGLSASLGLSPNNLQKNGIAMGFLPAWGEPMSPNTATTLNNLLPEPMSIMGAYSQILSSDPHMTQMDPYLNDLLRQPGDKPVFQIALMPAEGLANVTQEVADRIADKMASINAQGITVWLRYAHEMNGEWYAWGHQPEAFIASWNMVTAAVRAKAPDTYMLWSPNSMYNNDNNISDPHGGYTPYWPGKDNVDIVGLSFYHYGGFERLNNWPTPGEALRVMQEFDQLYGSAQEKPVILSETAAAFTRDATTFEAAPGNATENQIKWDWLWQITGPEIREALPYYRALCWFEVMKNENAAGNSAIKTEDFRVLTGNGTIGLRSRNYFASASLVTNYVQPPISLQGSLMNSSANDSSSNVTATITPESSSNAQSLFSHYLLAGFSVIFAFAWLVDSI